MFLDRYCSHYLDSIMELNKKKASDDSQTAVRYLQKLKRDDRNYSDCSICAFSGGKLCGYILADAPALNKVTIVSIKYTGYKTLFYLLSGLFYPKTAKQILYRTTCSEQTLNVIRRLKQKGVITLESIRRSEQHGDSFQIEFYFNGGLHHEWRQQFIADLAETYANMTCNARGAVKMLLDRRPDIDLTQVKDFVLREVNRRNMDIYHMFAESVPVLFEQKKFFSSEESAMAYARKFAETECEEQNSLDGSYCKISGNIIFIHRKMHSKKPAYDDLSAARYFFNRLFSDNRNGSKKRIELTDRYGGVWGAMRMPYCNNRTWAVQMQYAAIAKQLAQHDPKDGYLSNPSMELDDLGQMIGFKKAGDVLMQICQNRPADRKMVGQYFHDWNEVISNIVNYRMLLTRGAIAKLLASSYNAASKKQDYIRTLYAKFSSVALTASGTLRKSRVYVNLKNDMRKNISHLILRDGDLEAYGNQISAYIDKINKKRLRLSVKEFETLNDYLRRMNKYIKGIDANVMLSYLGKANLKRILNHQISGIFQPKLYFPDTSAFCTDIMNLLNTKTKTARRIYADLKRENLLNAVVTGNMTTLQANTAEEILKKRNCPNKDWALKKRFCAKIEPKCSPEYLAAGNATVCCMPFGSDKVIDYALEKGFGILNVYFKERIIANSVLWIHNDCNCLVFDNIEVHPNYICYNEIIAEFYQRICRDLTVEHHLDFAVQGGSYSDLVLCDNENRKITFEHKIAREIADSNFYSDAKESFVIMSNIPMETIKNRNRQPTAMAA